MEYGSIFYTHDDEGGEKSLTLFKKMAESFHSDPILKRMRESDSVYSTKSIVSIYANEFHVDENFAKTLLAYYSRRASSLENDYSKKQNLRGTRFVGDVRIFKENHDENFYMYRLDFEVFNKKN
jgi:hypothetical protein